MALAAGTRLGPYEITAPLGAGGMGEVYRARDSRLGRDVAVKVLPAHLAETPEVRARFEREARAVSALNHPHICTLHDIGREGSTDYLVMELVEGETLAERLAKGPLPPADVLRFATEIADALDKAHRAGIVHRDLKPGNVMVTRSGAKLMDFGLARAAGLAPRSSDLTSSPTVSRPLTAEGAIVGTFQYMAPEQLEGAEADARSDLWALGCVIYEMATGKKAFAGKSQASLIGGIMNAEPAPVSQHSPMSPPGLDRLVRACLAKDPEERIQTAHDVKLQLQWISEGGSQMGVPAPVTAQRRRRGRALTAVAAAGVLTSLGLGAVLLLQPRPAPVTTRFVVMPGPATRDMVWPRLSPDGRLLAFQSRDSTGITRVYVRPLDAFTATALPGTENVGRPFWSPDSRQLAFFAGEQLKKISVAGGPPVLICEVRGGSDGSWGSDGVILFDGATADSLRKVSAEGGEPTAATTMERGRGEAYHMWPWFLPDGKHFLFLAAVRTRPQEHDLLVGSLDGKPPRRIGTLRARVEYSPPGYIVYTADRTLMARRFDPGALAFKGGPFPIAEGVNASGERGEFAVSQKGDLAFRPFSASSLNRIAWVDRTGKILGDAGPGGPYRDLALSPDGTRLAYGLLDPQTGSQDIWVRDLRRGVASRLTFDSGNELWPVWSPDGQRITYAADFAGPYAVYVRSASGTGGVDTLFRGVGPAGPSDWSRDGRWLAFSNFETGIGDVWVVAMDGSRRAEGRMTVPGFSETHPVLSPDGRWVAYTSDEGGRPEIYVQPFSEGSGKWQVSTRGGSMPAWRRDGRELFYLSPENDMMAVTVEPGPSFEAGVPNTLFRHPLATGFLTRNRYVASADGQRFLLNLPGEQVAQSGLNVVLGWTAGLKEPK